MWNGGGNYNWQVLGTTNTAGFAAGTTWDLLTVTGTLDLTALSAGSKFNINLWSLASTCPDIDGNIADFDPTTATNGWPWSRATSPASTPRLRGQLRADERHGGIEQPARSATPSVCAGRRQLYVAYELVPEPSTYALLALALTALARTSCFVASEPRRPRDHRSGTAATQALIDRTRRAAWGSEREPREKSRAAAGGTKPPAPAVSRHVEKAHPAICCGSSGPKLILSARPYWSYF